MSLEAQEAKEKGNKAFASGNHQEAVKHFSDAIAYDPTNHILFSNRSAAYAAMNKYEEALGDAEKTVSLAPNWPKGYGRKGLALHFLQRFDEAIAAYQKGLELDPTSEQFKSGMQEAKDAMNQAPNVGEAPGGQNPFANLFSGDVWAKLDKDPRTADFKNDPQFVTVIENIKKNPNIYLNDERVVTALGVLLNIPLQPAGQPRPQPQGQPKPQSQPQPQPKSPEKSTDLPLEKQQAEQEKELGNQEYKQRNYEAALAHYSRAIELNPDELAYRSNKAAVYLEMGKCDECIKECEDALEEAKRVKVYTWNGKMANAFAKQEKWDQAISFYNKSLTEQRNADTLKFLQKAEKAKKEADEKAYYNPEISRQEKTLGNEFFAKQDYPEAVKHYNEAIKRNPSDHVLYSNRSACYQKLMEFPYALKDAEKCIELCPTFVKGYTRKAICHFYMKEYHKALESYDKGLKIDPNNAECVEGIQNVERAVMASQSQGKPDEEQVQHAMADPEIQAILTDPVMRQVLTDMQQDPRAVQRNAEVSAKISKLVAAGILKMG